MILENRYPVAGNIFLSRCIDGRYEKKLKVKNQKLKVEDHILLPALALPGGDLGELALILATGNAFGFEIDDSKLFAALSEIIGGEENFHFHTDNHSDLMIPASGCAHWRQIQSNPHLYNLQASHIKSLSLILNAIALKMSKPYVLHGEYREGAILMIKGDWGVYPQYYFKTEEKETLVQVFVYHQTLVNKRHRLLAKKLIKNQAVKLYPGCDEEYLYEVISEECENHFFETLNNLAKGLPIFKVEFEKNGDFKIDELGQVIGK